MGIVDRLQSNRVGLVLGALHGLVLAVIAIFVAVVAVKQQNPFKTHYSIMVVFLVVVVIYIASIVLSIMLEGFAQELTIFASLVLGFLAAVLLVLIMVPVLGWVLLAFLGVIVFLLIAYLSCRHREQPQQNIAIQMSLLDDGQREGSTRKWRLQCDYDVKNRTRLSQMIARCKAKGFLIHSVESCVNIWDLIMDDATGFSDQVYMLSLHFLPDNWIEEQWGNGFYITEIAGGDDGSSLVVMSKGTQFRDKQVYKVCESIPDKWMERKWKKGYSVTARATAGKKWAIVMSKGGGFSKLQVVEVDSNYPSERIHKRSDSGCDTTAMAETADQFGFVRSETSMTMISPR